jgi:hypothetical protein
MSLGLVRGALLIVCALAEGCTHSAWSPPTKATGAASQQSAQALPAFSQAEVMALLDSGQYAVLDQHFSALQQQYADRIISDLTLRDISNRFVGLL